ncbi:hypothetical protein BS78_01G188600 [Paspalum vaginatum]|nr:hypothetical protein BS78_01G188600 [Paspalum vaginatum]
MRSNTSKLDQTTGALPGCTHSATPLPFQSRAEPTRTSWHGDALLPSEIPANPKAFPALALTAASPPRRPHPMAGSIAVLAAILLVDLAAFGLAIGAVQSRPSARLETDARQEWTYCVYRPDAATALGGSALALLLVGQAVAAVASRCFCCGAALRPGGARACALVLYLSSWYKFCPADPKFPISFPSPHLLDSPP